MTVRKGSKPARDSGQVQVIARAARILWALRDHSEGLSLSQLAKQLRLARSTVHRIVGSLETERFVASVGPGGKVRLGLGLASLGGAVSIDLRRELRPHMEQLSIEVDEAVDLAVLDKDGVLFVDQVAAPRRLQAVSGIGVTFPLHCTANGKAMLSLLAADQIRSLVPARLQAFTPRTLCSREQLLAELESIRVLHIAYDREEHTTGICAIGLAFRDHAGTIAAVSIPVPSIRFYGNEERFVLALTKTGDTIRRVFGSSRVFRFA